MVGTCPLCGSQYPDAVYCPNDGAPLLYPGEGAERIGQVIGSYRLVRKVGEGGVGVVFEAEHIHIHKRVALKLLRRQLPARDESVKRLRLEARATSAIGHPNIVGIEDFGITEDGTVFMAMEWLEGESLNALIARGPIPLDRALAIMLQVCEGVAAAHAATVIHRDLKPENIFLVRTPVGDLAKILDFGVAKVTSVDFKLTRTGTVVGTPYYMAPEQATGREVDGRTDIYALGVILYEMVTGTLPFDGDTALSVIHMHIDQAPEPPRKRAPQAQIPVEVDSLIMRCLAKKPAARYQSSRSLADAIRALLPGHAALGGAAAGVPAAAVVSGRAPAGKRKQREADPAARTALVGERAREQRRGRALFISIGVVVGLACGALTFALVRSARDGGSDTRPSGGSDARPPGGSDGAGAPGVAAPGGDARPAPVRADAGPDARADRASEDASPAGAAAPEPDEAIDAAPRPRRAPVAGSGPDAGPAAAPRPPRRSAAGQPDAGPGDAPGERPGAWTFSGQSDDFDYVVTVSPAAVSAGAPFTLEVRLTSVTEDLEGPLYAGRLQAELAFLHFQNHQRTSGGSARVSSEGLLRTRVTLPRNGKYHVELALRAGAKRLAQAQFDVCVGADPRARAAAQVCPRLNRR
jgi:serine/threonine-protein kinase